MRNVLAGVMLVVCLLFLSGCGLFSSESKPFIAGPKAPEVVTACTIPPEIEGLELSMCRLDFESKDAACLYVGVIEEKVCQVQFARDGCIGPWYLMQAQCQQPAKGGVEL